MISHELLGTTASISDDNSKDKYILVDEVLSATNYYEALGLSNDSSYDEIRRAYIKKSRICHPDKFVPPYPKATKSFQLLSTAYNTLSQPSKKLTYDTHQKFSDLSQYTSCCSEDNAVDIFQQVIRQLYVEIMDGEFQTLRTVIHAINETNRLIHINDDVLSIAELGFLKIRDVILSSQKYYSIVQFELLRLYDLQDEIRNLSYFDVWRRLSLSLSIVKTIIQIPLLINNAFKKEDISEDYSHNSEGGLLGLQIENGLEKAISLFESNEVFWYSNSMNST